ncbi:MAG: ABC transporter substrate-binding protein [Proteobacteria bacterium]|nr:ABC transporter substrate-binding protein [Pseudomonadota bacterium]
MKAIYKIHIVTLAIAVFMGLPMSNATVYAGGTSRDEPVLADWARSKTKPGWYDWGKNYWPTKPVRGGIFRRAVYQYVGMMNPNHWPVNDFNLLGYFYEAPLRTDGQYRATGLWLASSFQYLNPFTVEMKLREGIKFHDGTDLNARSYKYLFEWIMDKKNSCFTRSFLTKVKSIEVKDDYTLVWRFTEAWSGFPDKMTNLGGWAISEKSLRETSALNNLEKLSRKAKLARKKAERAEKKAEKARKKAKEIEKRVGKLRAQTRDAKTSDRNPVGTGPYMLDEARPGNYVLMKRNPNWWFAGAVGQPDMPYFDGIKFTVIPDPAIQLANLRAGRIDYLRVAKSQYPLVKNDPTLRTSKFPSPGMKGLMFNHAKGPCQDIRVRKAVSHAIDRKALIVGTQYGLPRVASCLFPGNHWAHNPNLKPVTYDPELSKRLLSEAGYKQGLTLKGAIVIGPPENQILMPAIIHMLSKVGIDWKVDLLENAAYTDRLLNLEFDISGLTMNLFYDPDMTAQILYHPSGSNNNQQCPVRILQTGA